MVALVAYLATRLHLLRRRVSLDPRTGLSTGAAWSQSARRALRRAHAPGIAVLMLDIDRFKEVNDVRGHLAGDAVIASVARAVRVNLRHDDLAGRFGGDEFVVLLTGVTAAQALAAAERVRRAIEITATVTVSVGVATKPDTVTADLATLLTRADEALYAAKRAGGNVVRTSTATGGQAIDTLADA